MKAIVFHIQRLSVHDGPGIRTTVFLKGCPLDCVWCHNPESKTKKPVMAYNKALCGQCGGCVSACGQYCHSFREEGKHRFSRDRCTACGNCAKQCPTGALELCGREMTCNEVMDIVLRDRKFYAGSGGGLTVSGGEPMFHAGFTYELLKTAKKEGLRTCVESSLFCDFNDLLRIIPYTDLFLADWKETDDSLHKEFTGAGNGKIKENIGKLCENGAGIILRCPIIPGYNDRFDHYDGICDIARAYRNIKEIHLEPYNRLGEGKCVIFGMAPQKQIAAGEEDYILKCKKYITEKVYQSVKLLSEI